MTAATPAAAICCGLLLSSSSVGKRRIRMQRHGSVFSFFLLFRVFCRGRKTQKSSFWSVPFLGGPSPLPYHIFSLFLKSSFQVVEFFPLGGVGKTKKGPPGSFCFEKGGDDVNDDGLKRKKLDTTLFSVWSSSRKERDAHQHHRAINIIIKIIHHHRRINNKRSQDQKRGRFARKSVLNRTIVANAETFSHSAARIGRAKGWTSFASRVIFCLLSFRDAFAPNSCYREKNTYTTTRDDDEKRNLS